MNEGRIIGRTRLDRPVTDSPRRSRSGIVATEPTEDHVEERPVHALTHDVAEDRPDEPTKAPVTISRCFRA